MKHSHNLCLIANKTTLLQAIHKYGPVQPEPLYAISENHHGCKNSIFSLVLTLAEQGELIFT